MATTKYKTDNYPYQVYTALLTQSRGDSPVTQNSGLLGIGVTFEIIYDSSGMDFTNVGAPDNQVGTKFVATSDTPNSWGIDVGIEEILAWNEGAPVVTVLENTIGNIWFTYNNTGIYGINSDGLFTENKTVVFLGSVGDSDLSSGYTSRVFIIDNNNIGISSFVNTSASFNDLLYNTPIEIRVYK